jgi:hypothetical protein
MHMQIQSTSPQPAGAGGCLCGAVRFALAACDREVVLCHCADCRAASGCGPMPWASVPHTAFRWTRGAPRTYASSDHARRTFCGDCGAPLTFVSTRWPDMLDIAVTAFDDPESFPPVRHIFWADKPDWYEIADDLPRLPGDSASGTGGGDG